jgi:hypothetical protein
MKAVVLFLLAMGLKGGTLPEAPLLDQGFRQLYNLRFDEAHRSFAEHERQHPDDPLGPVSDAAACLFSEFDRLHILTSEFWLKDQSFLDHEKLPADPAIRRRFEEDLDRTNRLVTARLKEKPDDAAAQFAATMRLGLHSDYLALIEKRNLAALSEVKQSRTIAERLLEEHP